MTFICRFAPSPTGPLHIGGVRTALFNWLLAKKNNGKFYLRIEDTDKERSKDEFKKQIIKSLGWLGINHDGQEFVQSKNLKRHIQVADELVKKGYAYFCYCSEKDLEEQKLLAKKKSLPFVYNRKCRDLKEKKNGPAVLRFKSKISGSTLIKDLVQGDLNVSNMTIEDFVILRNDKTPTYQLCASVDDHDMSVTHVIRGDDHKINTFKQKQIFEAMGWEVPNYAHIPLIHSEKGKKLSKRDNASTIEDYIKKGILADALRNYLLRLGWSHKDKEIFDLDESVKLFDLDGVGKSPSKLDMTRILSLNEHYIKNMGEKKLFNFLKIYCDQFKEKINPIKEDVILKSLNFLKNKAKTLDDIYFNSQYILKDDIQISSDDLKLINNSAKKILADFLIEFQKMTKIEKNGIEQIIKNLIEVHKTNFKGVGQPLRIVLTGSKFGPGIYDVILSLDKEKIVTRLKSI